MREREFCFGNSTSLFAPTFLDPQRSFTTSTLSNLILVYPSSVLCSHLPFRTNESNICHLSYAFLGFREAFAKDQCYKLFRESFAASVLAFAEPSDINSLTSYCTSGFLRCSGAFFCFGLSLFAHRRCHTSARSAGLEALDHTIKRIV